MARLPRTPPSPSTERGRRPHDTRGEVAPTPHPKKEERVGGRPPLAPRRGSAPAPRSDYRRSLRPRNAARSAAVNAPSPSTERATADKRPPGRHASEVLPVRPSGPRFLIVPWLIAAGFAGRRAKAGCLPPPRDSRGTSVRSVQAPPATAGTIDTSSPALSGVASPWRKRTSSPLM
jgi:hypothetical protein